MRACIHRGSHQIGGSCVELEQDGKRLLLDLGLPLDAKVNDRDYLPGAVGLDGNDSTLLGILISHPHLDHYGLLAHVATTLPVGIGPAARRIIAAAQPFLEKVSAASALPAPGWDYQSGQSFDIGPFAVTPYLVDHSAYDAYAILIEAGGRRLFYSGDFRAHGRKGLLFDRLVAQPPASIDALLVEGSSLGRLDATGRFATEGDIEQWLLKTFRGARGLALVHTSMQNIDRVVSIFRAAKRSGRRLVIDLYGAAILAATGNAAIPQSDWPEVALYVPELQRRQIKGEGWFELLRQHSTHRIFRQHLEAASDRFALLFRPLHAPDLERAGCLDSAVYIYSQWEGYWAEPGMERLKAWLVRNGLTKVSIHTSGHASPPDLQAFVEALSPRTVVPIHSFFPERYPNLFPDANVTAHADGEWWEV